MNKPLIVLTVLIGLMPFLSPLEIGDNYLFTSAYVFKSTWGFVGSLLIFLLWLVNSYKVGIIKLKQNQLYLPVVGFLIWCAVTLLWVDDVYRASIYMLQFTTYALILFIVVNIISNLKQTELIIDTVIISLVGISIIGLSQYYFPNNEIIQKIFFQATPPSATFGNKNMASHFMAMTLPLAFTMLLVAKNKSRVLVYAVATALGSWFMIYTNARQAYLAAAIEFAILVLFISLDYWKNKANSLLSNMTCFQTKFISIISIALFLLLASNFTSNGWTGFDTGAKISRIQSISINETNPRIPAWINSIEMIKDNLVLGVGVGQWKSKYPLYQDKIMKDIVSSDNTTLLDLHNDYLQMFANVGLIGFSFLLWFLFLIVRKTWILLIDTGFDHRFQVLGLLLGMVGFAVVAMFSFPISVFLPPFLLMTYIGLIFSTNKEFKSIKFSDLIGKVIIIINFVILLVAIYLSYMWIYGDHYFYKSVDLHKNNSLEIAQNYSEKSIDINSFNSQYKKTYAEHLIKLKKYDKAIVALESIDNQSIFDSKVLLNLSYLYRQTNHLIKEKEVLERIIKFDNYNFHALSRLAYVYSKQKDNESASNAYKQMRDSFVYYKDRPAFGPYHKEAIQTSIMVKDYQFSNFVCEDLILKRPSAEHYVLCATLRYKYFDKESAIELFSKAIVIDANVKIPELIKNDLDL